MKKQKREIKNQKGTLDKKNGSKHPMPLANVQTLTGQGVWWKFQPVVIGYQHGTNQWGEYSGNVEGN
jgi:hypothetical protein